MFGVCVCCRDAGDYLVLVCSVAIPATVFPIVPVWLAELVSRKGDGFQTEEEVLGVGAGQGRKSSGRCDHDLTAGIEWDLQVLF